MITLDMIKRELRQEDIEGLIEMGAPDDEYDSEAQAFFDAVTDLSQDERTEMNLAAAVSLVWSRFFDLDPEELELRLPALKSAVQRLLAQDHLPG